MSIRYFAHDCYYILQRMYNYINILQEMLEKRNISFPKAEESIKNLGLAVRAINTQLDVNILIEDIKDSRFNCHLSKIPIDLLRRFKQKTEITSREGVVWYICSDDYELSTKIIYAEKYYLTAINCILENAIEYASPGSIICIKMYADKLEIINVGIPIVSIR